MSYYAPKKSSMLSRTNSETPVEDKDKRVPSELADTVSELRWSPKANWLAASSWDGKVHIYDVANDLTAKGVGHINSGGPLLTCDWNQEGNIVAGAGADRHVHLCSASDGSTASFEAHDAPIRSVRFVKTRNGPVDVLATGSWDRTVRYWDIRNTSSPLRKLTTKERVFAMDTSGDDLVIATAEQHLHLVDLKADPAAFENTFSSDFKHQTSALSVMPGGGGYAVGGYEGRVSIQNHTLRKSNAATFVFTCHRHKVEKPKTNPKKHTMAQTETVNEVYAVNTISWHPVMTSILATGGSDGLIVLWDGKNKARKYLLTRRDGAITAASFNAKGTILAYSVGYDWSKGYSGNSPNYPLRLMLHPVLEKMLK